MNREKEICAMCNEWTLRGVVPELTALGMGRCMIRSEPSRLSPHVGWESATCVSFRLDRPNLAKRRQYVEQQKQKEMQP